MDYTKIIIVGSMLLGSFSFLAVGVGLLIRNRHLKAHGIETNALVIEINHLRNSPVIEYETEQGTLRVRSKFSSNRPLFPFKEGDTIRIFYDKEKPKRFCIVGDYVPVFLGLIMTFLSIVGFGMTITAYLVII